MLLNFCHPCLKPEVTCSTISTDGHEVTNLVSEKSEGFLAYSCIKPPINIDLTFICNIQISRVIIWATVGSQKSSGFHLSTKSTTDPSVPYETLCYAYLTNEPGVIFYRRDIQETQTSAPSSFLQRFIKISDQRSINTAISLRVSIVKTENSVPALGRIEVWGRVSRSCGRDLITGINNLWTQEHSPQVSTIIKKEAPSGYNNNETKTNTLSLDIPEDFLDPITYEIMVQPIVLPSGKIVDQCTLERHESHEATWGRLPSDPFTGIPFDNTCRPAIATALKLRIDKFLMENSNAEEIQKLPRTVGPVREQQPGHSRIMRDMEKNSECRKSRKNLRVATVRSNKMRERRIPIALTKSQHMLPVVVPNEKQSIDLMKFQRSNTNKILKLSIVQSNNTSIESSPENVSSDIDGALEMNVKSVLSGLKRFSTIEESHVRAIQKSCLCCTDAPLYKLPCTHVVCRNILTSTKILQCQYCNVPYKTSDPQRIYK